MMGPVEGRQMAMVPVHGGSGRPSPFADLGSMGTPAMTFGWRAKAC
jgi:hypothetical protein